MKFKICTWNMEMGFKLGTILGEMKKHRDFSNLDVLALQEASRTDKYNSQTLAETLGESYNWVQQTADFFMNREQANALVWNQNTVSVIRHQFVSLPAHTKTRLPLTEKLFLTLMGIQRRKFLMFEAEIGAKTARIYVVHLNVWGFGYKEEQLKLVIEDMRRRSPVDLTIILGDMNTFTFKMDQVFGWRKLRQIAADAGFVDLTTEVKFTHHMRRINLRQKLDAIFIKTNLPYTYKSWSLDARGSDHLPVFAEIEIGD